MWRDRPAAEILCDETGRPSTETLTLRLVREIERAALPGRRVRALCSAEIAQALANWSGRDSLVVSLTGEWGTGKSTIKNFIIYHLKNRANILEFNPWQWSGQDKLLEAFLWQLGAEFGKEDIARKTEKLSSKWKAYASILKVGESSRRTLSVVATS